MARTLDWRFPLPRTHTGMLQGNGVLGLMIWGEGSVLRMTLGRADFWDHRGGMPWTERQTWKNIRRCLEKKDEKGLRDLFETTTTQNRKGQTARPSILPIGRLELDFGRGAELTCGELNLDDATARIKIRKGGRLQHIEIRLDMQAPAFRVDLPPALRIARVREVPSWNLIRGALETISIPKPQHFSGNGLSGWIQQRPVDPPLCVCFRKEGNSILAAVTIASDKASAKAEAARCIQGVSDVKVLIARNNAWWRSYWSDVPKVSIPNDRLQVLYDYGMYKFAGLTAPQGVAAGLQGPWIEDYQLPPWSADYHFNINVQMCYWPAFRGNRLSHLRPLFDLIQSWLPTLRHNAKMFLGIDDGIMLPHAVDDRCTCMGGFWTGSIDHGCTAWVAQMLFDYWRYGGGNDRFLREQAFPFMRGAMRVYEEMLERKGDHFVLPVSVSPEYRGSAMNAWGKNASFQLACIHRLCENLIEASLALAEKPRPIWAEILKKLPKAAVEMNGGHRCIALWEGTMLEESHRHHSHLAAIAPFDTINLDDPEWQDTVQHSHTQWVYRGMGLWSGWCVPWASMLQTRLGNPEMAELLLEIWDRVFTNEGRGTLHDCGFPGFTLIGAGILTHHNPEREIMQMDAGMGCVAAIQEMLLHERRGVHWIFRGCPRRWQDVAFGSMRTAGGFLVSAKRLAGETVEIRIRATRDGVFKLANPWCAAVVKNGIFRRTLKTDVLALELKAGRSVVLTSSPRRPAH